MHKVHSFSLVYYATYQWAKCLSVVVSSPDAWRRVIWVLLAICTMLLLAVCVIFIVLAFICHQVQTTHTSDVTVAWNQTVPVFSQSGPGSPFTAVDIRDSGKHGNLHVDVFVSDNFPTHRATDSSTRTHTLYPQLLDLVYAQFALKDSIFSLSFDLPSGVSLPLFVLYSFQSYNDLGRGHTLPVSVITPDRNTLTLHTPQDTYVFLVANITKLTTFNVTINKSLQLFVRPGSYLQPNCSLSSLRRSCHLPLSARNRVVGFASQVGQQYPVLSVSTSQQKWPHCTVICVGLAVGAGALAIATAVLIVGLYWLLCKRRKSDTDFHFGSI